MRLHRLTVRAFGPFADTVEVDFDTVSANGLFLIRGATGAGKTSLLDAVVFALYADVPGARSKKGLHSGHADRGVVPQVALDFTAGGRLLRVERSPEFSRPKTRGGGETTVPAKAVLFEGRGGRWTALSTRHDEIAEIIQEVLGLGLEQFSKVVLLPQGDFAAFLSATPEQRRTLLERLFDVSDFTGVEEWLAQRRRETAAGIQEHRAALAADLGTLQEVLAGAPIAVSDAEWSTLSIDDLPEALQTAQDALATATDSALAELDAARLSDHAATRVLIEAQELVGRRQRLLAAQATLDALAESQVLHEEAVAALEAATRAAGVRGDLTAFARAEDAVRVATERIATAGPAISPLVATDAPVPLLEDLAGQLAVGERILGQARDRVVASVARRDLVEQLAGTLERLQSQHTTVDAALTQAIEDQRAADAEAAAAKDAQNHLGDLRNSMETLSRFRRLRAEDEVDAHDLDLEQAAVGAARETAQTLRERYQNLYQARLDGLAAELAAGLHSGEPCPVCGSDSHPSPAVTAVPVTGAEVAAAERAWQVAAARTSAHAERLAGLTAARAARARELVCDGREVDSLDELDDALSSARRELDQVTAMAVRGPSLEQAVAEAMSTTRDLEENRTTLHDEVTAARTALAEARRELDSDRDAGSELLAAHGRTCPCAAAEGEVSQGEASQRLEDAERGHEAVTRAVHVRIEAARQLSGAELTLTQTRAALTEALEDHGFDSVDVARGSLLDRQTVVELRRRTTEYEAARVGAQGVLDDPSLQGTLEAPIPDLPALRRATTEARAALLNAVAVETLLRRSLDSLVRLRANMTQRCDAISGAAAHHEALRELADVVAGTSSDNSLRMRLSAFVLAARLEKVATLANERLATMGEGRYRLRHSDGLAARGARSGLGLEVFDLWTGQARETSSLSGGESFMASLALALGLADAVREEAGGFDLQTLFVDEGFGTLDDDSLEQVLEVLDGLREGGRAVGVVSHVAELRSRIPAQIVVDKSERGSQVRLLGVDSAAPAA
jgi:exonuclease SbcC